MIDDMASLKQAMEQMDADDIAVAEAAKDRAAQILSDAKLSFSKMAELIEQRRLLLRPKIVTSIKRMLAFATILGVADHWYEGDLAANLASVKRGLKVADEFGYPMYRVIGPLWATAALAARGPAPEVLEQLCGLLDKLPAENRCIQMPLYRILLANEFGRIGQIERARSLAASAEALVKRTGERWAAPEIYRIHGSLLCLEPLRDDRAAMDPSVFWRTIAISVA